ncbi:MAG: uroporphyrinogen decarboxylase family protein [Anaerolineae bacterium]|nr:uroporphyrinogen decarboxylase family protein [Anaerolineae bacterium]
MALIDIMTQADRRVVAPLMGYPGIKLTGSTIWQNEFNAEMQIRTLKALYERFRPDVMFPFMDLAVEAGAVGLPVTFPLNESPTVVDHPVKEIGDIDALRIVEPLEDARVRVYVDVVRRLRESVDCVVGAYTVGPFTLAGLMMGASEISMATILNPDLVRACLEFATEVIVRVAKAYDEAGAEVIAVLEPTASFISPDAFREFSGGYVRQIFEAVEAAPILHICGNTNHLIEGMCETGAQGLSLDSALDFGEIIKRVPEDVVLIGNVDPVAVMVEGTAEEVREAVRALVDKMAGYPNFLLSTGCDLPPETPLENIGAFMEAGDNQPAAD